jgi:hypothetical protein
MVLFDRMSGFPDSFSYAISCVVSANAIPNKPFHLSITSRSEASAAYDIDIYNAKALGASVFHATDR